MCRSFAHAAVHPASFRGTTFLLDYPSLEKEKPDISAAVYYLNYRLESCWDNLQELALAEMAAFSGGGGVAGEGRPQATYRSFFRNTPTCLPAGGPRRRPPSCMRIGVPTRYLLTTATNRPRSTNA